MSCSELCLCEQGQQRGPGRGIATPAPRGPAGTSLLGEFRERASNRRLLGELELLLLSSHLRLIFSQSWLVKSQLIYSARGGFLFVLKGLVEPTSVPQN